MRLEDQLHGWSEIEREVCGYAFPCFLFPGPHRRICRDPLRKDKHHVDPWDVAGVTVEGWSPFSGRRR